MDLAAKRRSIEHLLDRQNPADALASYYAFYHPDGRTSLVTHPPGARQAQGYVAISRTGMDLFRPLLTMRLLLDDQLATAELVQAALPPESPAILYAPEDHEPMLKAFFEVQVQDRLRLLVLDRGRYQPVINVLVTEEIGPNNSPRFVIRARGEDQRVVASAGINWQTPRFTELSVFTEAGHRRQGWGRSVVAALCGHILDGGRTPLYAVSESNRPSQQLAESSGFVDVGLRRILLEGVRRSLNGQ